MNHLSDEQLIEHHYGEGLMEASRHLEVCGQCAEAYRSLERNLAELKNAEPPLHAAQYGEQVWRSLSNSLPTYTRRSATWAPISLLTRVGYAAAFALLIGAAFLAGRHWERMRPPLAGNDTQGKQQVVLVVLGDHLDRSERLLIELNHVDAGGADLATPLQEEARSLIPENRRCRQRALQLEDPALAAVLHDLDRVLTQLANEPDGLSGLAIAKLQTEMNTDSLLFEIRVLRARVPDEEDRGQEVMPQGKHYEN